jgi:hypothetical protein
MRFSFLKNYEEWRRCIEVDCRIPLTRAFVEQRLQIYQDQGHEETKRFISLYGSEHLAFIIQCFEQARKGATA